MRQLALLKCGLVRCVTLSPVINMLTGKNFPACAGTSCCPSVRGRIIISSLKKEAAYSLEIAVNFDHTKRCYIPTGSTLYSHRPENLQSNTHISISFSCCATALFGHRPTHCWGFTRRLTTCGRTPLDEGSVRRQTSTFTRDRHPSSPLEFELVIPTNRNLRPRGYRDQPIFGLSLIQYRQLNTITMWSLPVCQPVSTLQIIPSIFVIRLNRRRLLK